MMRRNRSLFLLYMATFLVPAPVAEGGNPGDVNLAIGKSYALTPAPTYALCTDPGDFQQLTDGRVNGALWRDKATVGWGKVKTPPSILIDLNKIEAISEVRVHSTGGGKSGVFYPASIMVLVSDDNHTFHVVGLADSHSLSQQRFNAVTAPNNPRIFKIGELKSRGRYVLVVLVPDGSYVFTDEIEVLRGDHDPREVSFLPYNRFARNEILNLLPVCQERTELNSAIRALHDISSSKNNRVDPRIAQLDAEASRPAANFDRKEIRRLMNECYKLRGSLLLGQNTDRLAWAVVNPMEQSRPSDTVPSGESRKSVVELHCWRGEYESAAITLLNRDDTPLTLSVEASPLRDQNNQSYPSVESFVLRQAVTVNSRSLGPIGDALVKLGSRSLVIPGGQASQLWLTFHNRDLAAGEYEFSLQVTENASSHANGSAVEVDIPGRLTIAPIDFPDRATLNTFNWAYLSKGVLTSTAIETALADLRSHHINVFVFHPHELPLPSKDRSGRITIDFSRHEEYLRKYAGDEQLLFYWGCMKKRPDLPGLPPKMSSQWKALMKSWLREWVALLAEHGIGYDRFAMYPADEYIGEEIYETARFIKEEVDPRIRIFVNARGDKSGSEMQRIAPYVDIWCLLDQPIGTKVSSFERRLRNSADVWTYDCRGPSKSKSPLEYYRLQMWRAFSRGEKGCAFWVYTDRGAQEGNTWEDRAYGGGGPYDVIYGPQGCPIDSAGELLIPSRRWEAWREGTEDYEYLAKLATVIVKVRKFDSAASKRAQHFLEQTVLAVLNSPTDADVLYKARQAILAKILELEDHLTTDFKERD